MVDATIILMNGGVQMYFKVVVRDGVTTTPLRCYVEETDVNKEGEGGE